MQGMDIPDIELVVVNGPPATLYQVNKLLDTTRHTLLWLIWVSFAYADVWLGWDKWWSCTCPSAVYQQAAKATQGPITS